MVRYLAAGAKRRERHDFLALDRTVIGTSWGVGIAFDSKRKAAHKWESIRQKALRHDGQSKGLTGAALEAAVMAIAAADSSLVKIEARA